MSSELPYWHITDDPEFRIDPQRVPTDLAAGDGGEQSPGLMVTQDPQYWASMFHSHPQELASGEYENESPRQYAAEIDLSGVPADQHWPSNRGFGDERWVDRPELARVRRVLPLQEAFDEHDRVGLPQGHRTAAGLGQDPTFYYHWLAHKSCLHCGSTNLTRPRYPRGWYKCEDCNRSFDPMVPPAHMVGDRVIFRGYPSERDKPWPHTHLPYRPGMEGKVEERSQNSSNGLWTYSVRYPGISDEPQPGSEREGLQPGPRYDWVAHHGENQIEPMQPDIDQFPESWSFQSKVAMPIIPTKWHVLRHPRKDYVGEFPQFPDREQFASSSPEYSAWLDSARPAIDAHRQREQEWDRAARNAMATGRMSPEEVTNLGYRPVSHETSGDWGAPKWGRWQPLPQQLYHVTTNLPAIARSGVLRSPDELDLAGNGRGLGGGTQDTISFTDDPQAAEQIRQAMLEGADIASGRKPIEQLVEEARTGHGADKPWLKTMFGDYDWSKGNPQGLDDLLLGREPFYSHKLPEGHPLKGLGWTHTASPEEWAEHGFQPYADAPPLGTPEAPKYMANHVYRNLSPEDKAKAAFEWWRNPYASMRSWAGGPMDPLFTGVDPHWFANLDPSHVGIVQTAPVPGAHGYPMGSLNEWRVPTGEAVNITHLNGEPYQSPGVTSATAPSTSWHLTDDPQFALDPNRVPTDNALAISQRTAPGLYVGDPESWLHGHGYARPFVAEIEHPPTQAGRWNGESFIPAADFPQTRVKRVIPTDEYAREHYGSPGWYESEVAPPEQSKFPNYRYQGPDAREMTPEQVAHYRDLALRYREINHPEQFPAGEKCPTCHDDQTVRTQNPNEFYCESCGGRFPYTHGVISSVIGPKLSTGALYKRWAFSPASGQVTITDNSGDPLDVKYHGDLARELNEPNLQHGFAYRIGNGWRLTDWEHDPVDDPFIVAQVMRALLNEPKTSSNTWSGFDDRLDNWDRCHYGLPG